jgi:hypothetical protein
MRYREILDLYDESYGTKSPRAVFKKVTGVLAEDKVTIGNLETVIDLLNKEYKNFSKFLKHMLY